MRFGRFLGLTITVVSASALSMCGCASDGPEAETGGAGGTGTGTSTSTGAAGSAQNTAVRLANLSPDAPALDFCLKRAGQTNFEGPMLNEELNTAAGLQYAQVTRYITIHAGSYTVRLVAPGQSSCDAALAGTADATDVTLGADRRTTIALLGMAAPPNDATEHLQLKAFNDLNGSAEGKARLTFIHASPDAPPVDVGIVAGPDFTALFQNVAFGEAGAVGTNRYVETDPLTTVTIAVRPTGAMNDLIAITNVTAPAGSIVTVYGIGNVSGVPKPLQSLLCSDSEEPEGAFSVCVLSP